MSHPTSRPVLVVLGAGDRDMRAFALEQIAAVHPVLLMDTDPPAWAWPHATAGLWCVDLRDRETVAAALTHLNRDRGVVGVVTYLEHHIELAASLAEDLGLPNANAAAMRACRDKILARTTLEAHHVPSARFAEATDEDTAVQQAEAIGFPVVVKPRSMAGSAGVQRADTPTEVRSAYESAATATVLGLHDYATPGTLVEEYLTGPEISVECLVLPDDDIRIIAVTRKTLGPEPRFLEVGHQVDAADPLLDDPAIAEITTAALQALGVRLGAAHIELRLTPTGPRVIEVNGRIGGDLIPLLVQLATGISLPRAAAELALGRTPDLTPTRKAAAGVRFIYSAITGQLDHQRLRCPDTTSQDQQGTPHNWLERMVWTRKVGDIVEDALTIEDRIAHWVVTAPDAQTSAQRLNDINAHLTCTITPLAPLTSTCAR